MNKILTIVTLLFSLQTFGQVIDDFSDGDFTNNPVWTPDIPTNWVILSERLQSNSATVSSSFFITTPSTKATNAQWEFSVNLQFNTSSTNFVDLFLTSNLSTLTSATNNGYFVRIGGTPDEISLYKLTAGVASILINGADGITNFSNNTLRIKVMRNASNLWTLERDATGGTDYFFEGSATDNTFTTSNFFGVKVTQSTATFHKKHFFDDIYVGNIILDTTAPTLQSVQNISANDFILVFNEKLDAATSSDVNNFLVNNTIGVPSSASLQTDQKSVKLTFATSFVNGLQNQISVSGVKDLAGNAMTLSSLSFLYFIAEPAAFRDLVINELFPDPSPQIGLPAFEFVEIFNKSTKPFDLNGWKLSDPSSFGIFPTLILLPGEFVTITSLPAVSSFTGKVIGLTNFPTLNNSGDAIKLSDPTGLKIDSVNYHSTWYQDDDKATGGWTLERLNPLVDTNEETNWLASEDPTGGTPGKQNSVFGKNPDSKAPQLLNVIVVNQNEIQLQFNEALSPLSTNLTHYSVNGLTLETATLSADALSVQLVYSTQFVNGLDYSLTISAIQDVATNTMADTQKSFRYFVSTPVKPKDILINEIMADPSPPVLLFDAEYIELFNNTDYPFDLSGWKLGDATSLVPLSSKILMPHEYLILCSTSNASNFATLGKSLGVVGFPSINNGGEPIFIKDGTGVTIDSVNFSSVWYDSDVKKDGGWSLERLNPLVNSNEPTNWLASENADGGTPGKQNSVFGKNPDSKPPQLLSLSVLNQNEIELQFNEALSSASVDPIHYSVNELILEAATLSADAHTVHLVYSTQFVNGLDYSISISGVQDIATNTMADTQKSFRYFVSTPVKPKDILINEIMADPSPPVLLFDAEYIELFNNTDHPFDLNGWKLGDATSLVNLSSTILMPHEFIILSSTANASNFAALGKSLGVVGFPSINNSGEPLFIKDANGVTIDSVNFSSVWYENEAKKDGGWSLERLNPEENSNEPTNWLASENSIGGTPGKQNSVFGKNPDSKPPKLLNLIVVDEKELKLEFNEVISAEAIDLSHYLFNNNLNILSATLSSDALSIKLVFNTRFVNGLDYEMVISGIGDLAQNVLATTTKYFRYFVPVPVRYKDLIISEIMADPSPTVQLPEAEYIEIFNRTSNPFDINKWTLSDEKTIATFPSRILLPNEYLILTSTSNATKFSGFGKVLGVTGFQSLNNAGEFIVLKDEKGIVIDSVKFTDDWYNDEDKRDGGWSLEIIDVENVCGEEKNWLASEDEKGGTPGKQNSVFANKPDLTGPKLLSLSVMNSHEIILTFDEKLEKDISAIRVILHSDVALAATTFTDISLRKLRVVFSEALNIVSCSD
jgi:hypothetical protein